MKNEDEDLKKEDQIKDVNKSYSEMSPIKYIEDLFEKMPFTKWHAIMVIAMFTLRLLEGTETMSISIASAMLVKELKLDESSTATISGIIFTGNFLGSILSCILSDKIPRKYSIFLGNVLIVIFGGLSVMITDITYFIIYRNLVSLGNGLILSSSTAIVAENINPNYRGFILNIIILSASFGEILISFSLGNIIDSSNHFEWRKLLFISYSPAIISLFLLPLMPESLLFLIKTQRLDEAFIVSQHLTRIDAKEKNNFMKILSQIQENESSLDPKCKKGILDLEENELFLDKNAHINQDLLKISHRRYSEDIIFKDNFLKEKQNDHSIRHRETTTLTEREVEKELKDKFLIYFLIMIFAFLNSYLIQGIRYILPKTLSKIFPHENWKVNLELQISSVVGSVVAFFTGILIEMPYFKRLKLLVISIFATGLVSFISFSTQKYIDIFACILKTTITVHDQVIEVYSTEMFETENRVFMLSIFNIFSGVPVFLSPFINDVINHFSFTFTYFWFGVIAFVLFILSFFFKNETFKTTLK